MNDLRTLLLVLWHCVTHLHRGITVTMWDGTRIHGCSACDYRPGV
jgi:hypothetical protein